MYPIFLKVQQESFLTLSYNLFEKHQNHERATKFIPAVNFSSFTENFSNSIATLETSQSFAGFH